MKVRKKKGGRVGERVETPTFVVVSLLIDHLCAHLNQPCFSSHYFSQCILLQIIYFTFYILKSYLGLSPIQRAAVSETNK